MARIYSPTRTIVTILILYVALPLFGQVDQAKPIGTNLSPDAMGPIQMVNSSVDYSTGTTNVQIPLFQFKTVDQNIPISLVYQASGNKALDSDKGPLGAGWTLAGSGKVTCIIMM